MYVKSLQNDVFLSSSQYSGCYFSSCSYLQTTVLGKDILLHSVRINLLSNLELEMHQQTYQYSKSIYVKLIFRSIEGG